MKFFYLPLLILLTALSIISPSCESSTDNCYTEIDTAQYIGILGDWHRVGIADGEVNKVECFTVDTTGMGDIINSYSFQINNKHYESSVGGYVVCTYEFSPDRKTLYYYDYESNSTSDTTKLKIARLDSEYMVLIFPSKYEGQKTTSQLYQRK